MSSVFLCPQREENIRGKCKSKRKEKVKEKNETIKGQDKGGVWKGRVEEQEEQKRQAVSTISY